MIPRVLIPTVLLALAVTLWGLFAPARELNTGLAPDSAVVVTDTSRPGAMQHPDAGELELWSVAAGVPVYFTFAVAWEETRNNADPSVRGAQTEWGRFQIKPSTAAQRCPGLDVRQYHDNLACFLRMAREDRSRCGGWECAARIHNGSGARAEAYADRVRQTYTTLILRRLS